MGSHVAWLTVAAEDWLDQYLGLLQGPQTPVVSAMPDPTATDELVGSTTKSQVVVTVTKPPPGSSAEYITPSVGAIVLALMCMLF